MDNNDWRQNKKLDEQERAETRAQSMSSGALIT
jgi:hypothetical protein